MLFVLGILIFVFATFVYPLFRYVSAFDEVLSGADEQRNRSAQQKSSGSGRKKLPFTRFVNFGNLPSVQFNRGGPKVGEHTTIAEKSNQCKLYGMRVSELNEPHTDCKTLCKSNDTYYKYMEANTMLINNVFNSRGGYCLPKQVAHCNESTAQAVLSNEGWTCQSRHRMFGGVGGSEILGCNGVLRDNLLNKTYRQRIPNSVTFDRFETVLLEGPNRGKLRFECGLSLDKMNNRLVDPETGDPYERIENYCTRSLYNTPDEAGLATIFAPYPMIDFKSGQCKCVPPPDDGGTASNKKKHGGQTSLVNTSVVPFQRSLANLEIYDTRTTCVSCRSGFEPIPGDLKAWPSGTPYQRFALNIARLCISANDTINDIVRLGDSPKDHMPCGVSKFSIPSSKCHSGIMLVTNDISPYMKSAID